MVCRADDVDDVDDVDGVDDVDDGDDADDVDDMDDVDDVEERDLVCRADEPASSHQRGLYTSGWGEMPQKLCLLGHTANQNIRSTLLKKSGFNGMRLGPISVPVTSLSLRNIFNGTITQIKSSRSK